MSEFCIIWSVLGCFNSKKLHLWRIYPSPGDSTMSWSHPTGWSGCTGAALIQLYQQLIVWWLAVPFIDPQWISAATGEWRSRKYSCEEDGIVLLDVDDWLGWYGMVVGLVGLVVGLLMVEGVLSCEVHFPERWRERSVVTGDGLGDIIHELGIALHTTFVVGCTNS